MTEIKSHEFDAFLAQGMRSYRIFVIFGPDRGLVSERASAIAQKSGIALDDPFSVTRLDAGDLGPGGGRLLDEVGALGLFGGDKLIWVKGGGNDRGLIDAMPRIVEQNLTDTVLIIEAGDIKKGVGLRKLVDGHKSVASIACYADDRRALNALIDTELAKENLRITPEARDILIDSLGGDRLASRNELQKLALYARGEQTIDAQHVTDIVGDASSTSVDDAVDAIFSGDKDRFIQETGKVFTSKTPVFLLLQSCLKQLQLLDILRSEMEEKKLSPQQVMQTYARHVHFRRKPILEAALRIWSPPAIAREMRRVNTAILQTRQRQALEDSIALQTLLALTLQSGKRI
ncbi:DNA polymerase III subunit delta [Rhizobium sp. YJ-22]|uniref:DNA polymerase III subunit delta n=1 Tax=Rhizobium sp. YJ-22 TaxID=3037556 RepID=UPI002412C6E1|nr:DNA polymerase III subunit delta [Rhizobium sp. YJ-22]MDG3577624.1 DNA polymerase III subunit delta [Rhizobium sp. YJ-22]